MKTVFPNPMVAHVWAQQNQPEGHGSNFFFAGPTIYSYGRHFPIASFVKNKKGARAVLFTDRDHSISTSRHKSYVRQALRDDVPRFTVNQVFENTHGLYVHDSNMSAFKAELANALNAAAKPRIRANTRAAAVSHAEHTVERANEYADFFGLKKSSRLKAPDFAPGFVERLRQQAADAKEKAARAGAALERKAFAQAGVELADWLAGGPDSPRRCPRLLALTDDKSTRLRVVRDVVQTSLGAEVPADEARRAVRFIQVYKARGENWERNGERMPVGHFEIDSIDGATGNIKAGCHFIAWAEIARILPALGFTS